MRERKGDFRVMESPLKMEAKREKEKVRTNDRRETRKEKGKMEKEGGEARRNGKSE